MRSWKNSCNHFNVCHFAAHYTKNGNRVRRQICKNVDCILCYLVYIFSTLLPLISFIYKCETCFKHLQFYCLKVPAYWIVTPSWRSGETTKIFADPWRRRSEMKKEIQRILQTELYVVRCLHPPRIWSVFFPFYYIADSPAS